MEFIFVTAHGGAHSGTDRRNDRSLQKGMFVMSESLPRKVLAELKAGGCQFQRSFGMFVVSVETVALDFAALITLTNTPSFGHHDD